MLCAFMHGSKVAGSSISKNTYFKIDFIGFVMRDFYFKQIISVTKSQITNLGKYALFILLW
jgi:hypothetical protein